MTSQPTFHPRVAISACLMGQAVRYDGGDKRQPRLLRALSTVVDLQPVCPEVGAGLSTPRPPVRLVDCGGTIKALGRDDATLDVTVRLQNHARHSVDQMLEKGALCGWIFKSRSPSCGHGSTPLYSDDGQLLRLTDGIQAGYVRRHLPWLVCREETELQTVWERRHFVRLCYLVAKLRYQVDTPDQRWAWVAPMLRKLKGSDNVKQLLLDGNTDAACARLIRIIQPAPFK